MGLALQLLIQLSRLLKEHGVSADPDYAQELVERVRARFPDLLSGIDPGNHHTPVASAVALALAIDENDGNRPEHTLALTNALEWVLKKQVGAGGTTADEQIALEWARQVLARQRQLAEEGEGEALWRPEEREGATTHSAPPIDPMLMPDVPMEQIAKFMKTHGLGGGQETVGSERASMGWRPKRHADGAGNGHETGTLEEPTGQAGDLVVATDNGEVEPLRQDPSHWLVVAWAAISLLLPPLGLLVGGYYGGRGKWVAGVFMVVVAGIGWAAYRTMW